MMKKAAKRLARPTTESPPLTVDNFTHLLECHHCIGRNRRRYWMKCHILGTTKTGKLKVQVYGTLHWGGAESKIRYVDASRVQCKSIFIIPETV